MPKQAKVKFEAEPSPTIMIPEVESDSVTIPDVKRGNVTVPDVKSPVAPASDGLPAAEREGLRQMREILFRSQMGELEHHIEKVQNEVNQRVEAARREATSENTALEARLRSEIQSLKEELLREKAERKKALKDIVETTSKAMTELQERFVATTDQIEEEKVDRALLAQLFRHISKRFA